MSYSWGMSQQKIIVLDFGSQYAHLIAKRLRLLGFYSEIAQPSSPVEVFKQAKGIVFSGGPASVYDTEVPSFNAAILDLGIPILGLCYGHQLIAKTLGGEVAKASIGEFGIASLCSDYRGGNAYTSSPLFENISLPTQVWMSHQDAVVALPEGFEPIASTKDCEFAGMQNLSKKIFSLQCHIEVKDTPEGDVILFNFANTICQMQKNWDHEKVLEMILTDIRTTANASGKNKKVLLFLSGGVDSTVAFALLNKALGQERVLGLHIDNGFMRKDESEHIAKRYTEYGFTNFIVENASSTFLEALKGLTDPQEKRMAVGETFIKVRNQVTQKLQLNPEDWLLGQGTLYPDIIESGGTENSHVIKTHHNRVEGIQTLIEQGLIIEPLKELYKDEVRLIGKKMELSSELIMRHPFPGPGLSINVLCSKGESSLSEKDIADFKKAQDNLFNFDFSLLFFGQSPKISILPVRSVGVQGDFRTYRFPAVLDFGNFPSGFPGWEILEAASSAITNGIPDVNRTILTLWKNPKVWQTQDSTEEHQKTLDGSNRMHLQEGFCTKDRLDQTRAVDAIVLDELKKNNLYAKIFQHLTINLPYASQRDHCSIVLRPVVSEDVMTARFAHLKVGVLNALLKRIYSLDYIDAIYYDITNKPPATFGWE